KLREGAPVALPAGALNYAGFWIRFLAKIIDWLAMGILTWPVSFLFGMKMSFGFVPGTVPNFRSLILVQLGVMFYNTAVQLLYNWLFVGRYGATPGKMALG